MDEVVYDQLINSNHLLLILIMLIFKVVRKSAKWSLPFVISYIYGM